MIRTSAPSFLLLITALVFLAVLSLSAGLACNDPETTQQPTAQATTDPLGTQNGVTASVPGVTDQSILFGQSAALTGPAFELGRNMQLGIEAAFHQVNQSGGVYGRTLELHTTDDAYEPEAAIANTLYLINEQEVFALIGAVGTPTSRSAAPVAAEAAVPYIAPFTGAEFLRDPEWANILNLRSSYYQETEEMVARLTQDLGIDRIAVMYQDDSFGRAGYQGVRRALDRRSLQPVSIGLYPRNTTAVKTALLDIQLGEPEAVIMIGAYKPVAELIAWGRHTGLDPVFMTVSFVGSNALAEELGPNGTGVYVTQVVPFPTDNSLPVAATYLEALAEYSPDAVPGFVSFEGYLAGRLAIAGLQGCGQHVDRTCFLNSLRSAEVVDIDGFELQYGDDDNQGSDAVFLTMIGSNGEYHPVNSLRDETP